jgi:5-methylcytosine-specific restriction endonuclease McrA
MTGLRPDRKGSHRTNYEKNKRIILKTQNVCGICGKPVDMSLKYGDPMAPCVDHIIPIAKGGHPSDISNLQLSHWTCNRQKSDKIFKATQEPKVVSNRNLPHTINWAEYKS